MPIFVFCCEKCGKEFERLIFSSEEDAVSCPKCESTETKKLVSVFSCSGHGSDSGSSCGPSSSGGFS